ncbi:uncharacterized protein LOC128192432 [Crassostrea angulata]|uniref:uncharacterized protein LOC128192432 n=1 Tax=Magallana angulata TaxID=2784310 RepID=UPI00148A3F82|nr:uncharacterized protein LOC117680610 [Crassostrea gigas]XP_052721045.1 uncharacterized protein LOC128192432 [Crassostrea angulata]
MMEKSFQFCSREATIKALKSEVQKFNSRVDRACARALNLDRMTREYFTKMIPKDMNNNTPSCSGRESGNPEDGLVHSQGRILEFLKRPGRKIRVPNRKQEEKSPSFWCRVKQFFGFQ